MDQFFSRFIPCCNSCIWAGIFTDSHRIYNSFSSRKDKGIIQGIIYTYSSYRAAGIYSDNCNCTVADEDSRSDAFYLFQVLMCLKVDLIVARVFYKWCYCSFIDTLDVCYCHAIVGYRDAGLNCLMKPVVKLLSCKHASAALNNK